MTGIDSWSTTAATNATADGGSINWAEGQAPSTVNNTARQMCADVRSAFNDLAWFQYGSGDQNTGTHLALPAVYASGTSFTYAGVDVTAAFHQDRRLRAVGVSTGTIYGRVSSSSFSTNTTVNAIWDSGSLSNETLTISLSQVPVTGRPAPTSFGTWTPTDASGAGLSFSGSTGGFYRKQGASVLVWGIVVFPATGSGAQATIGSLPFTASNTNVNGFPSINIYVVGASVGFVVKNTQTFGFGNNGAVVTNATMSGLTAYFSGVYPTDS